MTDCCGGEGMAFVIKAFVNRADKDPNIGLIEKISYGLGDFSSQLLLTPVSMLFMGAVIN